MADYRKYRKRFSIISIIPIIGRRAAPPRRIIEIIEIIENGPRPIIEIIEIIENAPRPIIEIIEIIENGPRDYRNYRKRAPGIIEIIETIPNFFFKK